MARGGLGVPAGPDPREQGREVSESKTATAHLCQHHSSRGTDCLVYAPEEEEGQAPSLDRGGGGGLCGSQRSEGCTRAHTSSAAAGRWAPADLCGVPPLDASPACSARGRPYLPLHDGLQQGQHRMPSLGRPLWLQQVRDSLPECFHCMLPGREGMAIGVLAPQLRGQSHGHRTEQNMLF